MIILVDNIEKFQPKPKSIETDFSGGTLTSNAGLLLISQVSCNLILFDSIAMCFEDSRNPKVVFARSLSWQDSGFWGFVLYDAWFVKTVELGSALSIIYVALIAVRGTGAPIDRYGSYVVTQLIGLFHRLGFAFVLHELLLHDGAHLWKTHSSFNVGVEI